MTLKEKVIQKIEKIEDPELLADLGQWISQEAESQTNFSARELMELKEGLEQYQAGNIFTQQEAQKQFQKWLEGK